MTPDELSRLIGDLIQREALPEDFAQTVDTYYRPLAAAVAALRAEKGRPVIIGINGSQGSGKSTLAEFLKLILGEEHGLSTAIISIDDLYLTHAERQRLAADVHPLLATRGVPGTHDVALGVELLDQLTGAGPDDRTAIPRFDKSSDDRFPVDRWDIFQGRADVVILEGWCVAATPETEEALGPPINELERSDDPDSVWRHHVNVQLATVYPALFGRLDYLVMLKAPGFGCVRDWRLLQEEKLRRKAGDGAALMDRVKIERFIMHYERLTRHMLRDMPRYADAVLELGRDHRITAMSCEGL